jgi:uncharacterized SAM-binding protein YcdF (DUF218 family)
MKKVWLIFGGLGLLLGGYITVVSLYLPIEDAPQKADAIVAISGGDTNARVLRAIELYKQGLAPKLIFSGAAQDPNSPSNAFIMRRTALRNDVPESDILIDESAKNTMENAQGVGELLGDDKTIILVTSEYHQRRAAKAFAKNLPDVTIINIPAEDKHWGQKTWWLTPYGWWISVTEPIKLMFS